MGSSTSKSIDREAPVTPEVHRRSCSRNVFPTSCLRPPSRSPDCREVDLNDHQVSNHSVKERGIEGNHSNISKSKSKGKTDRNKKVKLNRADKHASEWGESSLSGSTRNPSNRFLSRFTFFPGNISSCSSRAYPESSSSSVISNDDIGNGNKTKRSQGCEIFPSCFLPTSSGPLDSDSDSDSDSDLSSLHEMNQNGNTSGMESNGNLFSPRNGRRMESREPVEQNVRFSRTLSVGRLRDRVLHRPPFPELASFPLESEREVVNGGEVGENGSRLFNENVMRSSNMSSSLYGSRDFEIENMGARETSYANLLEHRSNFLERRRRIRSQVHALQRMGSRFENMSGHERSCIMSGQHRTGHCTCRLNNQDPNDGANARGSISRIVLLAEALFEVLDEIHQQSVVSSSQPALSSIGSVPAPIEVVEALPVKLYCESPKHLNEDDAQCYICLLEYEDGDEVRVLPCHHEFHRSCIDKWLKEIHRICPLCRGDVCKTGSLPAESSQHWP